MSNFAKAMEIIIATHEGGFQNRADDPGNWTADGQLKGTKFGISAHSFPEEDIEGLTLNRAEDLYRQVWGCFAGIEDQRVLTKVLDLAVNMQWAGGSVAHPGPATEILQRALSACGIPVKIDGALGPKTITATTNLPADVLLKEICTQAEVTYAHIEASKPAMKKWFTTWEHRAKWLPPEETA